MMDNANKLWTWEDGQYYMPHCWGSEALSYRTDLYKGDPAQLSYGSLWDEGVKGHVQGRPHSYLLEHRPLVGWHRQDAVKPHA